MKKPLFFFLNFFLLVSYCLPAFAQENNDSLLPKKTDTQLVQPAKDMGSIKKEDTGGVNKMPAGTDTQPVVKKKIFHPGADTVAEKNSTPTVLHQNVSLASSTVIDTNHKDTPVSSKQLPVHQGRSVTDKLLAGNRFIDTKDSAVFFIEKNMSIDGKEFMFYALCVIVLILGIFKTFYDGYFKNLFRVYFNTSLRQTQLADQLVQAKLPSFILNIFFAVTTGIYLWLLFNYYHPPRLISSRLLLPFCILCVALLYFIKFCILKFMGWVSDIRETTDNYIFAIFLVNKIIGILLVPVIVLLAFLKPSLIPAITNISFMMLGLFFLSRYVKSYSAIERKMPLNSFHFIIYIIGAEIIPLLILYKIAIDYVI